EATAELRAEIRIMRAYARTPQDFGLKVRAHPKSLIVTAKNKMRTAETIERNVSLSGEGIESSRLRSLPAINEANIKSCERFIGEINAGGWTAEGSARVSK